MHFDLFGYLFSLGVLYVYGRLLLHYGTAFIHYMVNNQFVWKLTLERPRLLFILVGLGFMHLMLYAQDNVGSDNLFVQSIIITSFGLAFFLAQLPWTEKFKSSFDFRKSHRQQKNKTFEFKISDYQIQQLYNGLVRYDFLCSDKTSLQDFQNVLTTDWDCHSSRIYLNLDGPSCREFYDHLVNAFPNNSSTLKSFFETSELIVRANGKPYRYNTVKNAPTRTPVSKQYGTLIGIFNKLK